MQAKQLHEFGPFRLNSAERVLLRGGEIVPLTPKVFDVLALLVERNGHLLGREELLSAVWADSFVEEANLTVSISALRKALGERADGHQYVETIPKRGYRFVADVKVVESEQEDLILGEQTMTQVVIEQEVVIDGQSEVKPEIETRAKERARAKVNRRVKPQALIACMMIAMMVGAAYWWKVVQTRQADTNAQIRSIAVLPFKQMGGGEGEEWVSFGLADVLITRLGSLKRVEVRPASAVFKYIGAEQDIPGVGRELKVDAVLEGSIQRSNGHIRITARLVRVRDERLLWAETFDGRFGEVFALQDEISERVAVRLALKGEGESVTLLTKRYTESTEAHQAYLRGRYFWNKRYPDNLKKAIGYFEEAIRIDRDYALAYTGLADCYSLLVSYIQVTPKEGFPKAKESAQRAIELDDTLAEAHASLAKVLHLFDWSWEEAEKEFNRAIELNPNYATAHQWYGEYLISLGRFDEAKAEMKRALENDPASLAINVAQGFPYYYNREYDEAIAAYKRALDFDPTFDAARFRLFQAYYQKKCMTRLSQSTWRYILTRRSTRRG